ncbi:putative iron-transport related exported protein [Pseudomonas sp. FH4]|uniref:Iron complex outermembrane recepter protein n=1 Tax=Pseudomonas brenneri TaxID=129817 RepID=A0A5B2UQW6_9PSED|nr:MULTISPECIES: TonB-dependent siderophore receptor [Pseudomonas fluorescens group]MDZ4300026.1 TonB-dependent siderophore receptor [Pseudomonas sp.]ETK21567.1 putative iron-transport related exported protein [Pseudomonas sp. FH4]KAA2228888.1 TonB-dependent siderophore receptor [Pseudomonas brenneri]MBF8004871.1 TonB-dependent siderophore receptor [Pseudomonas brenneri]TWR76504.1 TonB-dependent siderophore receptor [Pseudomonas brenneri]
MPASRLTPMTLGLSALLCAGFACAATTLPATSISAEADEDDPRVKNTNTATRTATPVRYVPQAIDSVKTENLRAYGTNDLGQALSGIPNVSSGADTRFDSLRIRGFEASSDFYLDGIRDDSQYVRDLHNIERIDVLKGPAAVLYGRGGQGGIVNRVSKLPQAGRASSIEAQGGTNGTRSLYTDLSADPTDNISLRLNMGNEDTDSLRDNISGNRKLFAPSMSWQLTPQLNWLVQYEYSRYDRTPDRGIPGVRGRPADVSRDTTYGDPRDYIDDTTQSLRSKLAYELNDSWQLRHTLGVFKLDSDFDNTYLTGYDAKTNTVGRQRWQQDLTTRNVFNNVELEGGFNTFGLEHRLLTGIELGSQRRDPKLSTSTAVKDGGKAVPSLDLKHPNRHLSHTGPMFVSSNNHTEVESQGLYVQDQLRLNDQWQVLAGLRYDRFEVDTTSKVTHARQKVDSHNTSPRLGVVWTPVENHSFYASWSKTFSPTGGGLIGITPNAAGNANDLSPELTKQKEIGVKSDWLDDRLSTTLAVYELELYNRRTRDPENPLVTLLSGVQRSRGIELTTTGKIVGNWYVRGGVGVQDAKVVKDNNGFEGKRISDVAKRNASLFVTWKPEMGWYAETGLTLVGERYADNANTVVLPGYGRWDALAGFRHKEWDVKAALNNISDKTYYASATSANQIQFGDPRSLVVTGTYNF